MLVLLVVLVLLVLLVVAPTGQVTVVGCRHRSVLPSVEVALPPQSGHNRDDTHVNVDVDDGDDDDDVDDIDDDDDDNHRWKAPSVVPASSPVPGSSFLQP